MDPQTVSMSLKEVGELAFKALLANKTGEVNARSVADSVVVAEAEGIRSHGLARLSAYCDHARCGKVDGNAVPSVDRLSEVAFRVDAKTGFAHPAIDLGFSHLAPAALKNGIAALAVTNSYNCGVVGYHVERLAREGLVALAFVNSPSSIAPWGGKKPLFGTNPIAFAPPRLKGDPVIIDQSSSVVARGEIMLHEQQGKPIPEGWAIDCDGQPTTDPKAALHGGSLLPAGGYKGAGIALLVEIMAAGLTGANFSFAASSYANNDGGPPRTGQFFIGISPAIFAGSTFDGRMETLFSRLLSDQGTRLPGEKRAEVRKKTAAEGVTLPKRLYDELLRRL
jgi:(2R)-3-sulfolactate dehydrogenase (NADP+)